MLRISLFAISGLFVQFRSEFSPNMQDEILLCID